MSYRIFATLGFSVCVSSGIKAVEGSTAKGLRGYMQRAWNYSINECIFNVILWLRTEFSKQYGKKHYGALTLRMTRECEGRCPREAHAHGRRSRSRQLPLWRDAHF